MLQYIHKLGGVFIMKAPKKTQASELILIKELQLNGFITIKDAMDKLCVSEATARRIFARMEEKGVGIRSHGKISLPDSSYNFYRYEASNELYVKEKKQIAEEAVKLVKNGDVLFLDSGTTICIFSMALAEALRQNKLENVKVFTNSYMIINVLNDLAEVCLIGGTYRPHRKDFCGYMTEKAMKDYHFDKCFLGTDGFSLNSGFTTTDFESAKICESAIERSTNAIILMDFHKYAKSASITFSKGDNISLLISNEKLSEDAKNQFLRLGINFRLAKN